MSEWYEAEDEDINITENTVDILVANNEFGNIYVTLTHDQFLIVAKAIDLSHKMMMGSKNEFECQQ